jgi:glyoxylase-like metal-dependent hydrolase (beta-lactamase superfamily II)
VDTCVGNDKDRGGRAPFHMMQTTFLDDLKAAGVAPESVDLVVCTHLHVDHVGWNTRLDMGRWVPTFPRAASLRAPRVGALVERKRRRHQADHGRQRHPVLDAGWPTWWPWTTASPTRCGSSRRRATRPAT